MPLMFLEPFLIGIAENPSNLPKKRRGKGYAKSAWHLTCMRLSYVPGMNAINRAKDSEKNAWHLLWVWHPWPKTLATSPKLPPQKCLAPYLPGTLPCLRKSAWHLTFGHLTFGTIGRMTLRKVPGDCCMAPGRCVWQALSVWHRHLVGRKYLAGITSWGNR